MKFAFADGVRLNYKATRNGCDPCALNDFTAWQQKYGKIADHGTAFEGTDGWVMVHRGGLHAEPENLLEKLSAGSLFVLSSEHPSHMADFLNSVKTRTLAICPMEDTVQADVLCQLGDIAVRLNRPLKWDPVKEHFFHDDEANRRLALRAMRDPWQLS